MRKKLLKPFKNGRHLSRKSVDGQIFADRLARLFFTILLITFRLKYLLLLQLLATIWDSSMNGKHILLLERRDIISEHSGAKRVETCFSPNQKRREFQRKFLVFLALDLYPKRPISSKSLDMQKLPNWITLLQQQTSVDVILFLTTFPKWDLESRDLKAIKNK